MSGIGVRCEGKDCLDGKLLQGSRMQAQQGACQKEERGRDEHVVPWQSRALVGVWVNGVVQRWLKGAAGNWIRR